jgi:hypothetical protein
MKVKGLILVLGFQGFDLIQHRFPRIAHTKMCLWEAITGFNLHYRSRRREHTVNRVNGEGFDRIDIGPNAHSFLKTNKGSPRCKANI